MRMEPGGMDAARIEEWMQPTVWASCIKLEAFKFPSSSSAIQVCGHVAIGNSPQCHVHPLYCAKYNAVAQYQEFIVLKEKRVSNHLST